jgi:membrane protein implicated in regulation of membrane protease activity
METAGIVYIVLGVISLIGLLLPLILGHDHDFGHDMHFDHAGDGDHPSIFSIRSICVFLLAFSIAAYASYYTQKPISTQIIFGFLAGLSCGLVAVLLMRAMWNQQGSSMIITSTLHGTSGRVIIGTTRQGVAQIELNTPNGSKDYLCKEKNQKELEPNDTVMVVDSVGDTLIVEKQN